MNTVEQQRPESLHVGRYQVFSAAGKLQLLGGGAFGSVFLGSEHGSCRRVAIKILHWQLVNHREIRRRFENEIRIARRFDHPGLVHIIDDGVLPDGRPYLVMEYLAGETLHQQMLRHPGGLPIYSALNLGLQLTAVLRELARFGIVNRDLKPANIMVVPDPQFACGERYVVIDFGIAKLLDRDVAEPPLTLPGAMLGTPSCMAPEQILSPGRVDSHADTYAFGAILFGALAGRLPFSGNVPALIAQQLNQAPPALRDVRLDVPLEFADLVSAMLAKEPALRPSIDAVAATLQRLAQATSDDSGNPLTLATHTDSAGQDEQRPPGTRRPPRLLLLGCLIFLATLLGVSARLLYGGRPAPPVVAWTPSSPPPGPIEPPASVVTAPQPAEPRAPPAPAPRAPAPAPRAPAPAPRAPALPALSHQRATAIPRASALTSAPLAPASTSALPVKEETPTPGPVLRVKDLMPVPRVDTPTVPRVSAPINR